uniref:UPF0378 protein KIAA0100-like n=1 Tax=Phallusia mammillata TaxID=59560 RepID=A0A6F9DGB7_9ASCI|nr:UPF0378 protein KIAA0100-like [Phallusia mammillata]
MLFLVYFLVSILIFWLLVRFSIWQVAKLVKSKFNVDVAIKSIGLFSANEITIRVNQLQTIEIDKVTLRLKLFDRDARHLVTFHIRELRVRAETNKQNLSPTLIQNPSNLANVKTHKRSPSFATKRVALLNFVQRFFKYASLNIDVLNLMLLNALVPDSLVHLNLNKIRLASENTVPHKDLTTDCAIVGSLSIASVDGKVLKSPKEASEVTSCIAEISTALELVISAEQLFPTFTLASVDAEFARLQVELHEGALIPGILFPKLKIKPPVQDENIIGNKFLGLIYTYVSKVVDELPNSTCVTVKNFGLAFFGDETMGETTRGAHVVANKVALRQFKDASNLVAVKFGNNSLGNFNLPCGYVRLLIDDVTMTDYYKRKVGTMGKTLIETKLNANGVLSTSLDLTSWHADYKHKESVAFWSIIFNKLHDAKRQQSVFEQTVRTGSGNATSQSTSSTPPLPRRTRTYSAPDSATKQLAPDILKGTESASHALIGGEEPISDFPELFREAGISIIFECTIYDASIDVIMTPLVATGQVSDFPPSFSIGLDSFTVLVDQSFQSRDFNFMSKLDHFWCLVEQDNDTIFPSGSDEAVGRNHPTIRPDIHEWGHVIVLENLRLHGSASFKQPITDEPSDVQEVALLIDAKISGLQLELSKFAAQALQSCFVVLLPPEGEAEQGFTNASRQVLRRQMTTGDGVRIKTRHASPRFPSTYKYTVACVEVELLRVNAFIISSDDVRCAECVIVRVDQFKAEITGGSDDVIGSTNRVISLVGVAIATVHNPFYSAFASYEAGRNGSRSLGATVSPSMRRQQTVAAAYTCQNAALMGSCRMAFSLLELNYSTKHEILDDEFGGENISSFDQSATSFGRVAEQAGKRARGVKRHLAVTLTSEGEVVLQWSPALHAMVHYQIIEIFNILAPYLKRKGISKKSPPSTSQLPLFGNNGDQGKFRSRRHNSIRVGMHGDGYSSAPSDVFEMSVNLAPLVVQLDVTTKQCVKFCVSELSCEQSEHVTAMRCDEVAIVMDDNQILTFTNNIVELSSYNADCQRDRQRFPDLRTPTNRAWAFSIDTCRLNFPYKYDFAATFDQTITTWKWVKGLYRKTSHPFRSAKLPPDLFITVTQFTFELADWLFECRLHDNHELMMDEWTESEKRRRVLDQRMAEMRRQRGEILPAKKVEELYRKLAHTNIKIYQTRSRKMYKHRSPSVLLTWSLTNFTASVLADETTHGMRNAMETIKTIDHVSPFPYKNFDGDDPEFVTLWCRHIRLNAGRHQVRLRNYPQCMMDYTDWKVEGKFCGAEQKGPPSAQRTEYVPLPAPWDRAAVLRNMPALKFYYDLTSEVNTFNMAWGPCWDPAWSQVNLAFNLLSKLSVDPSNPLPWWDKSRLLFHGRLAMFMERANLLHLASLDPYNTTEHMHWDWKNMSMGWTPGCFLFKGDLDIHIRNASKYDDIRFLHLPNLMMECSFDWICLQGANPHDHHVVNPSAPDKIEGDANNHDSFRYFRSRNIDLSIKLDTRQSRDQAPDDVDSTSQTNHVRPEVLLYSTTLRWLSNFMNAINAVARPICKGAIFGNQAPAKLKLSRHYRKVKVSFAFPELKVSYWSSYAQQLGIEWLCGSGEVEFIFRLVIIPYEGDLIRRSLGDWSVISTTSELKDTTVYLLRRRENMDVTSSPSSRSIGLERNFFMSLSKMSYRRDNVSDVTMTSDASSPTKPGSGKGTTRSQYRGEFDESKYRRSKRQKKPTSPTKRPQSRQNLVVHDLKAMWTIENRDVAYGLYEGYNKSAVLRRNLSTKILSKFRIGADSVEQMGGGSGSRRTSQMTPDSDAGTGFGQEGMDPSYMLRKLRDESKMESVVGAEDQKTVQQQLKGITASTMDDVVNKNWLIKFVNCQAMLKGPQTQGYIILTAAQADFLNRDHRVMWRKGQLTTKSSWVGSLSGMQVFATVEKTGQAATVEQDADVPWFSVSDIAPRDPSPGMLNIYDLKGGGQAIGGVVGDGVASSFQLQRIMSRCTCRMYYVGYEALIDSEQTDYVRLLPETPADEEKHLLHKHRFAGSDLLQDEKPVNVLTISQTQLDICTNTSQFTMILDIVENLLLYVEPVMRDFWERIDRMRFQLRLTSSDDAAKQRDTLAAMQNRVRSRLTNMRQLERQLFRVDRAFDIDPSNTELSDEATELRLRLAEEKETLNEESEELGIIIRCFKEMFLEQKTRNSSLRPQDRHHDVIEEEEASVARTTEVMFGHVQWHLTDADGQLNIAQFEMKDFLYEKINKSDDTVSHCFELGSLTLQNLLPNSLYRDVIKRHHHSGLRSHGVSGTGGRSLTFRVLCRVRPPVGGISVKDHVEVNAAPLTIQLTYQFFKRMMAFFFPDKGVGTGVDDEMGVENKSATLLGVSTHGSGLERHGSILSLPSRPPPPSPSLTQPTTPMGHRKSKSMSKAIDDVDKMKQRAAQNNTFLYIKITQVPLCVSYKGEKEKNIEDVHEFNITIPMFEYHSMTWTWHDFAMAVKRDCKKQLVSQLIKEKLHISGRHHHTASTSGASESEASPAPDQADKAKLLFGNSLQRTESTKRSFFKRKK